MTNYHFSIAVQPEFGITIDPIYRAAICYWKVPKKYQPIVRRIKARDGMWPNVDGTCITFRVEGEQGPISPEELGNMLQGLANKAMHLKQTVTDKIRVHYYSNR